MKATVIRLNSSDNVATALTPLTDGSDVEIPGSDGTVLITIRDNIPFGHKFALDAIASGEDVIKYGASIGMASRPIEAGDHVHVHNMESKRGRGDMPPQQGETE